MTIHSTELHELAIAHKAMVEKASARIQGGIYRKYFKRVLDVTLVLMASPIIVTLVLVSALMLALDGHRPFYVQKRVGRGGRTFRMWKLRTMVHDADAKLEAHLSDSPEARLEWDTTQKLKKDPRITRMGAFLRKSSLDELPQLWNVLIGDMSLVGPRPMMESQRGLYHGRGYYTMRPGVTGFWQISDRNDCDFSDRVQYDEAYARSVSLTTDATVILRTFGAVMRCTGY